MKGNIVSNLLVKAIFILPVFLFGISGLSWSQTTAVWQSSGQNLTNLRFQPNETTINASNVNHLSLKWTFTTGDSVSATPTVSGNVVYVTDWIGDIYAVAADTGKQIWTHKVSDYDGMSGAMARVSPLILGSELIIGDNVIDQSSPHHGASVIAVNAATGDKIWITQLDPHPAAVITGSPIAFNNIIYVPVSSVEETLAANPSYACCTFRGSIVALNAQTGAKLWQTFTVPDNLGATNAFSGSAIWQPPAIDTVRGVLYTGTGNNYTVPASVQNCQIASSTTDPSSCTPANDHVDTVMALDLKTGAIKWASKMNTYDTWTVACLSAPPGFNCPKPTGPDFDFTGSGPNLINSNMVGFAQKNGVYWALNPDTGAILWSTMVGPGSELGGILWGTASDGNNIYAPISNWRHTNYPLQPSGSIISWGSWAGLNAKTGKILWQTADPQVGALDAGAASVANGVVYVGSMSGLMAALDASTGKILWSFNSVGSVIGGPAIVNGVVYWGSGYHIANLLGTGNNKLFAFSLPQ